jgi:hypothetical protein
VQQVKQRRAGKCPRSRVDDSCSTLGQLGVVEGVLGSTPMGRRIWHVGASEQARFEGEPGQERQQRRVGLRRWQRVEGLELHPSSLRRNPSSVDQRGRFLVTHQQGARGIDEGASGRASSRAVVGPHREHARRPAVLERRAERERNQQRTVERELACQIDRVGIAGSRLGQVEIRSVRQHVDVRGGVLGVRFSELQLPRVVRGAGRVAGAVRMPADADQAPAPSVDDFGEGTCLLLEGIHRRRNPDQGRRPGFDSLEHAVQEPTGVVEPLVALDVPALRLDAEVADVEVRIVLLRQLIHHVLHGAIAQRGRVLEPAVAALKSELCLDPEPETRGILLGAAQIGTTGMVVTRSPGLAGMAVARARAAASSATSTR